MISELESKMIPKGRIDLIGLGRLGIRTGLNLIEVHRGGPIEIAGGNTIPTAANIIKHVHSYGGKTISTAGIFGVGDEKIEIKDISEFDDTNPAVEELRKEGITENHLVITTGKFIRDMEPVTPYTLDEVAKEVTKTSLKLLIDIYD